MRCYIVVVVAAVVLVLVVEVMDVVVTILLYVWSIANAYCLSENKPTWAVWQSGTDCMHISHSWSATAQQALNSWRTSLHHCSFHMTRSCTTLTLSTRCVLCKKQSKKSKQCIAVYHQLSSSPLRKTHVPYGITQCYLPPDRGENPAFSPSQSRYSI